MNNVHRTVSTRCSPLYNSPDMRVCARHGPPVCNPGSACAMLKFRPSWLCSTSLSNAGLRWPAPLGVRCPFYPRYHRPDAASPSNNVQSLFFASVCCVSRRRLVLLACLPPSFAALLCPALPSSDLIPIDLPGLSLIVISPPRPQQHVSSFSASIA